MGENKQVTIALGAISILLLAGLAITYVNYTAIINDRNTQIQTLTAQINSLQAQLADLQDQLEDNLTLIDSLNSQIASLQNQLGIITSLPDLNLTIVGASGQQVVLLSSDIAVLDAITAAGGTRSSSGKLANFGNYTGIPILTLLNLVGGVTSNSTVKIIASDNYTTTYTYEQLNGEGISTYNSTGDSVDPTQDLTVIVAYYCNGTVLTSNVGPLRMAIVGPEDLYSTSSLWSKMVVKIEVLNP